MLMYFLKHKQVSFFSFRLVYCIQKSFHGVHALSLRISIALSVRWKRARGCNISGLAPWEPPQRHLILQWRLFFTLVHSWNSCFYSDLYSAMLHSMSV